jgi:hypothetical protein
MVQALTQMIEQTHLQSGVAPDANYLLSVFGGLNRSGNPALQGAAGASVMQNFDAAVRGGGTRGTASAVFEYNALARAYPELKAHPYLLEALIKAGIGVSPKSLGIGNSTETVGAVLTNALAKSFGISIAGPWDDTKRLAFYKTGMGSAMEGFGFPTPSQAMEYMRSIGASRDRSNLTEAMLKRLHISTDRLNPTSYEALADIANGRGDDVRLSLLASGSLSRAMIPKVARFGNDDLARLVAELGGASTSGRGVEQANANLVNAQQDLGAHFTELTQAIKDLHADVIGGRLFGGGATPRGAAGRGAPGIERPAPAGGR